MDIDHSKHEIHEALGISKLRLREMAARVIAVNRRTERKSEVLEFIAGVEDWSAVEKAYITSCVGEAWMLEHVKKGKALPQVSVLSFAEPGWGPDPQPLNILIYYEYDEQAGRSLLRLRELDADDLAEVTSELHPDEYAVVRGEVLKEFGP